MATKDTKSAGFREAQFVLGQKAHSIAEMATPQALATVGEISTPDQRWRTLAKYAARVAATHAQAAQNAVAIASADDTESDASADAASWMAGAAASAANIAIISVWMAAEKGTEEEIAHAGEAAVKECIDKACKAAMVTVNKHKSVPEPVVSMTVGAVVAGTMAELARIAAEGGETIMPIVAKTLAKFEASIGDK